ncbi:MAG: AIR synthase-related protein, partial [Bacteroidota bacterium]
IGDILAVSNGVRFMRDATRGGLASVLAELASLTGMGIHIEEKNIPLKKEVRGMCELLGFDPLHVANEGKVVMVASRSEAEKILKTMTKRVEGKAAAIIGEIVSDHPSKVVLKMVAGGSRYIEQLSGDQLPRIC